MSKNYEKKVKNKHAFRLTIGGSAIIILQNGYKIVSK